MDSAFLPPHKRIKKLLVYKFIFLSLVIAVSSCGEDPMFIGRNLLPPADNIILKADTSTSVIAYTASAKPIITTSNDQYLLGTLNDPVFGYYEASFISQIDAISARSLPETRVIDSLVIQLRIKGYLGDSTTVQTLQVYEVTEDIMVDSAYFSNTDPDMFISQTVLGSTEFLPGDSIISLYITDPEYLNKFVVTTDTIFSNNLYFREVFKGLYFKTIPLPEHGGAISYLNLSSQETNMILYYDTVKVVNDSANYSYQMYLGYYSNAFNIYHSDHTSYPPEDGLNNPETKDTVLFSTSMAGLDVRIRFPDLEKWRERAPVSIIKAELFIYVEDSVYQWKDSKQYPQRYFLYSLDALDNYQILYDYNLSSEVFGGYYDVNQNVYKINISYYLQSYLDGKLEKSELVLITTNNHSTANRVLLKSPLSTSNRRMKLKVIYQEN